MKKEWFLKSAVLLGFIGASLPMLSAQTARTAIPGTVNYLEGQVSIDGSALNTTQIGNAVLGPNQILSTGNGKAEVLLSPGVFVRAGSNTQIRMISPELVDPRIEVIQGEAMIEVDLKPKDSRIDVLLGSANASILKEGLYRFNSAGGRIEVIDGKLQVAENGNTKELGQGKEVTLNGEPLKTVSFDRKAEDDLYRWSSVRSAYLAQANQATAQYIYAGYDPFWGSGWYWNPYFTSWSWLPGDGFFYSPFGYPFFSPAYAIYAPRFGYGYGRFGAGYRGGFASRGIAMAPRASGFAGGGFHGGGGGGRR
jgi:hypothetical protein